MLGSASLLILQEQPTLLAGGQCANNNQTVSRPVSVFTDQLEPLVSPPAKFFDIAAFSLSSKVALKLRVVSSCCTVTLHNIRMNNRRTEV